MTQDDQLRPYSLEEDLARVSDAALKKRYRTAKQQERRALGSQEAEAKKRGLDLEA